jgi:hypothetical protein
MSNDVCYAWSLFHNNGGSREKDDWDYLPLEWIYSNNLSFVLHPLSLLLFFCNPVHTSLQEYHSFDIIPVFFLFPNHYLLYICSVQIQWRLFVQENFAIKRILRLQDYRNQLTSIAYQELYHTYYDFICWIK